MRAKWHFGGAILLLILYGAIGQAQTGEGIDQQALIDRILAEGQKERAAVNDLTIDAELIEGETKDGVFREKERFLKRIYLKYLTDTTWCHEEYLDYYKDSVRQSAENLRKAADERLARKAKHPGRDISFDMLRPFRPGHREKYSVEYKGPGEETIDGHAVQHFVVTAKTDDEDLINGEYFFDAESLRLVRVNFSPAKAGAGIWFKVKALNMTVTYTPGGEDYWVPKRFDFFLDAKATLFIKVKRESVEYYSNPRINTGLEEKLFKETP